MEKIHREKDGEKDGEKDREKDGAVEEKINLDIYFQMKNEEKKATEEENIELVEQYLKYEADCINELLNDEC